MPKPKSLTALLAVVIALHCLSLFVSSEVYLHFPPGSNNRNREQSISVANPTRLFRSRNAPQAGYSARPPYRFYSTSILSLQWTSDAGSGKPVELSSQFVVQYTCDDVVPGLRDGSCKQETKQNGKTSCLDTSNLFGTDSLSASTKNDTAYGLHESYEYFEKCAARGRNQGLFLGNSSLPANASAQYSRQNPTGITYGTECQEERDYYPYWHPSEWKDLVVLVDDLSQCKYYRSESQNVKSKGECSLPAFNNPSDCSKNGGTWREVPAWGIPPPRCVFDTESSPNSVSTFRGLPFMFNWTLPSTDLEKTCVLRVRYNITSAQPGLKELTSDSKPPLTNEAMDGGWGIGLKISNTKEQYGVTYEDRSFVFKLLPRPSQVSSDELIYNFNQMGKRGLVGQVFPSMPYSFAPRDLLMRQNDWVHFQWSGSDYNPPEFFGNGLNGTDRGNLALVAKDGYNVPVKIQNWNFFAISPSDTFAAGIKLALADQKGCPLNSNSNSNSSSNSSSPSPSAADDNDPDNCGLLNKAEAYFDGGLYHLKEGKFVMINTRNHIFGATTQMGYIEVHAVSTVDFVLVVVWVLLGLFGFFLTSFLMFLWARYHPTNALAKPLNKINPWAPRTGVEEAGGMYLLE